MIEELMKMAGHIDYHTFVQIIEEHIHNGILDPVKSSGKNGRRPALFNKYRIKKPETNYDYILEKIKLLHPKFNHSKYAKHPEMYAKYEKEIDQLNQFLWEKEHLLEVPLSINERSFQIWGEEKLLKDKSTINSIFKYNDWDLSFLNYYETPEPFFEYIFANEGQMNVLIIENKDTWFTLRKIMRENQVHNLYRPYHVLLYGEGKKIISRNKRLQEYDKLLEGSQNSYYYFGDLDYQGIEIYQTLVETNPKLDIHLCTELYQWMLLETKNYNLPKTKQGQKKNDLHLFLKNFTQEHQAQIQEILENRLYIPQEILNYALLKSKMLEGMND